MRDHIFETSFRVSWGDCDPAGIAHHPNAFRWLDATFQAFLASRGVGQQQFRHAFAAAGFGLVEAGSRFSMPLREGDLLAVSIRALEWRAKVVRLSYAGTCQSRPVLAGHETRALFVEHEGRLRAAPLAPVRKMIEGTP